MSNKVDIYILLTDTGTLFTRLIRLFTKYPLNHASIAFDSSLKEVYSFGRKKPNNPFLAGFVKEDVRGALLKKAGCAIYRCSIDYDQYTLMREIIQQMEEEADKYKYNLLGLMMHAMNMELRRDKAFFCTQFVATVFNRCGVDLVRCSPYMATPMDLADSHMLDLIYIGKLNAFTGLEGNLLMTAGATTPSTVWTA